MGRTFEGTFGIHAAHALDKLGQTAVRRFESLGEVVHYLKRQQLNAHKFKLCYVCDIALE